MVLYFTGTGNSRYLARRIAERLEMLLYDLNTCIKAGDTAPVQTGQDVVLVTPTYAWRIPRVVSEWLGKTALTGAERNARIVGTKAASFCLISSTPRL
ncbi:flavodoxin domain-containing protein [Faecalibacterium sp. OF04-11AC]|uniref:flavodoxin domain-containing protein n=1 Tax=Faecalibacterium sp. OF04-11AC TaxID=2293109 RepID=UPI001FA8FA2A|nr:flavodoxin domain-containing protein [Faecalibacterium sp. OF04-11AC]